MAARREAEQAALLRRFRAEEMLASEQRTVFRAIFTRNFLAVSAINMLGLIGYYAIFVLNSLGFKTRGFQEWCGLFGPAKA